MQSGYGLVNAVAAINAVAPSSLAASTTAAGSSTTTPTVNQSFNLMATLTGGSGTPTGSVDFYDISYNTDLGSMALSGGVATLATTPTTLGAHVYLLTYGGNGTYAKSTAYLVLDVVSQGGGANVARTNGFSPSPSSLAIAPTYFVPVNVPPPAILGTQAIDDMAGGIATLASGQGAPVVKKPSNGLTNPDSLGSSDD